MSAGAHDLRNEFENLFLESGLPANRICRLAWLIKQAGEEAPRAVGDLALPPAQLGGGNSSRHLSNKLGVSEAEAQMYRVRVPCMSAAGQREHKMLPVLLPHSI